MTKTSNIRWMRWCLLCIRPTRFWIL